MITKSLAHRIVLYLVVAQLAAFLLGWVFTLGLGMAGVELFATTWDELAKARAESRSSPQSPLAPTAPPFSRRWWNCRRSSIARRR